VCLDQELTNGAGCRIHAEGCPPGTRDNVS
jgi:hypothetical protein